VRSFTATKSMLLSPSAARMMLRPMRPNPLMPTFTAIEKPSRANVSFYNSGPIVRPSRGRSNHVPGLQHPQPDRVCRRVAVLRLSSGAIQEVHRQPAPAPRVSTDFVQCRWRILYLDPCRLGGRSADGARHRRRPESALSAAAPVSLDHY